MASLLTRFALLLWSSVLCCTALYCAVLCCNVTFYNTSRQTVGGHLTALITATTSPLTHQTKAVLLIIDALQMWGNSNKEKGIKTIVWTFQNGVDS